MSIPEDDQRLDKRGSTAAATPEKRVEHSSTTAAYDAADISGAAGVFSVFVSFCLVSSLFANYR